MRLSFLYIFLLFVLVKFPASAQVVTVTNPGNTVPALNATYPSLQSALTALNAVTGVNGPVIITLNPANPQTAPAGGFIINYNAVTSAINNIIIEGSGNTITAFNPQPSGSTLDAIIKIIGADHVTISNFVLRENPANTTSALANNNMTEWGIALLCRSTSDGAQHNSILNNVISLNRNYANTFGIYSNTRHSFSSSTVAVDLVNGTAAPNHGNKVFGNQISNVNMGITFIGARIANYMDVGNDIGGNNPSTGNTITNFGGLAAITSYVNNTGTCYGIYLNHQKDENTAYNTIESSVLSGTNISVRGIYKNFSGALPTGTFTSRIAHNTITMRNYFSGGTYELISVESLNANPVTGANIVVENNLLTNNEAGPNGPAMMGIHNTFACGELNITGNVFTNNTTASSATNVFTGIQNAAAVTTAVNISGNALGSNPDPCITFSEVSNIVFGINLTNSNKAASISINNNSLHGFIYQLPGQGNFTGISFLNNTDVARTVDVNNNLFDGLDIQTSGNVTLINRTGVMAANAGSIESCTGNAVVNGMIISGVGTFNIFNGTGNSSSGNVMLHKNNNFSGISGSAGTINGWYNFTGTASAAPEMSFTGNTFTGWNFPQAVTSVITFLNPGNNSMFSDNLIANVFSEAFTGIQLRSTANANHICSNNEISNIESAGNTAYGIRYYGSQSSTANILNNVVRDMQLNAPAAGTLYGIYVAPAMNAVVSANRISDLTGNAVNITVSGIAFSVATNNQHHVLNNLIGNLYAPVASGNSVIRAINYPAVAVNSTFLIDHNTIYLAASSSAADFGTTGIYLTGNATSTSGNATLRNNLVVNVSTASGTGRTSAYMRSNSNLGNYNSNSNNNIWYAGDPSASNLIFYNIAFSDQTLDDFKLRVGPVHESNSLTEMPAFLSLNASDPDFLHLDPSIPTSAESSGMNLSVVDADVDGDTRFGYPGYIGTGTAPDIGADEIEGVFSEKDPPVIVYTPLASPTCNLTSYTLSGVTISDASGVPLIGADVPRIYYRKPAGTWYSRQGVNAGGDAFNSVWDFTIIAADMGGLSGGETVEYFVTAQDISPAVNVGANAGTAFDALSVHQVLTPPDNPHTYTVGHVLTGSYTVGTGGDFETLTEAIQVYNTACGLNGAIVFNLTDPVYTTPAEVFPINILQHPDASAVNTLTIKPDASDTCFITGASNTFLIGFNGSDHITFDGRNAFFPDARMISLKNTGTGVTLQFFDDATHNAVEWCNVQSGRQGSFSGTIYFGPSAVGGQGNDHNSIADCRIFNADNSPTNAIFSQGTTNQGNDSIQILNNEIFDFFRPTEDNHGIFVNGNNTASAWEIIGNSFYQTERRLFTGNNIEVYGIRVNTGSGYLIRNNRIGWSDADGLSAMNLIGNSEDLPGFPDTYVHTGTATPLRFFGITGDFDNAGVYSEIDGNEIGGINIFSGSTINPGVFNGIYIEGGPVNIGMLQPNIIGSATEQLSVYVAGAAPITFTGGIRLTSAVSCVVKDNIIGGWLCSGVSDEATFNFTGISAGGAGRFEVRNNQIGNSIPANLRFGNCTTMGMLSASGTLQPTGNALPHFTRGIAISGIGTTQAVESNILQGWVTSQNNSDIVGISVTGLQLGGGSTSAIKHNQLGTIVAKWLRFENNNISTVTGIFSERLCFQRMVDSNSIRGFEYAQSGNYGGICRLISTADALNQTLIRGNIFTDVQTRNQLTVFIESSGELTVGGIRRIEDNHITGNTLLDNEFIGIRLTGSSSESGSVFIRNNIFEDITGEQGGYGIMDNEGEDGMLSPRKVFVNNRIASCSALGGFTALLSDRFGSSGTMADSISANVFENLISGGDVAGVSISTPPSASNIWIAGNEINQLSSNGVAASVTGIAVSAVDHAMETHVSRNTIHSLDATGSDAESIAIHFFGTIGGVNADANKVYNIQSRGKATAMQIGDEVSQEVNEFRLFNNLLGDIKTPLAGNVSQPTAAGIRIMTIQPSSELDIFNNTIHLNAAGSHADFSSAAVFAATGFTLHLENNIFSNVSTAGSNGRTVALWRSNNNLSNFSAATNNYYAGNPAASNLLYYDQSNSFNNLNNYQSFMGALDVGSISMLTQFLSITGAADDYLHLDPQQNCNLANGGSNDRYSLQYDFDGDTRETPPPSGSVCAIGADELWKWNVWTGGSGNVWNDPGNWSAGVVPDGGAYSVLINQPLPTPQPVIGVGENYSVLNLRIHNGAVLANHGTIEINGTLTADAASINNLNVDEVQGSVAFTNDCAQTLLVTGSVFVNNKVKDLIVQSDAIISNANGEGLWVYGALDFGTATGKTLHTADNLTIGSDVYSTGRVAPLNGNLITGEVTVERYVNTGLTSDGRHPKSWQLLSTPVTGTNIFSSWQESGLPLSGYGTILTGTGSGFDITTTLPSMKWYNSTIGAGGDWQGVTNTGDPLHNVHGYMLFVRGDRTVTTYNADATPTILRMKGTLFTPDNAPPAVAVPAGRFASVGNPYASPINLEYMRNNGHFSQLDNNVVVWDPLLNGSYNLGGWQTLSAINDYEPTAGGTAYYPSGVPAADIQSGQAFFVRSSGLPGNVTFSEQCKSSAQRLVHRGDRQYMRIRLFTDDGRIADGVAAVFDADLRLGIDENDARKLQNDGENFAITIQEDLFSVEARPLPEELDTIHLAVWNLRKQAYSLRFFPRNMNYHRFRAYLADRYLNTLTELPQHDTFVYTFRSEDHPASSARNRFYIVFKRPRWQQGNEIALVRIQIAPNPVTAPRFAFNTDGLPTGRYSLSVYNASGSLVYRNSVFIDDTLGRMQHHPLPEHLAAGIYKMMLRNEKNWGEGSFILYR